MLGMVSSKLNHILIVMSLEMPIEANIDALKRNDTKSKMFDDDASASDVEDYFSEQE